MGNFISDFANSVKAMGCGITLDSQKHDPHPEAIQFLWAAPINGIPDSKVDELSTRVHSEARSAGLQLGDVSPYSMNLPNETAVLESCPFQPELCTGRHLVISGAGLIK